MAIRSLSYAKLLERYRTLCGVDELSIADQTVARSYIQRNLRWAWEAYDWPSVCPVEPRETDASGFVPFVEDGETEIGEVFVAWNGNPEGATPVREIAFRNTGEGLQFFGISEPTTIYLHYRKRVPELTGTEDIPYELFEIVAQASYCDWLISNEQAANGIAMRRLADEALIHEIDKVSRQQRAKPLRRTFYTHGTEQLRQ